ncbi:CHASE2 domain-containing protein [Aurantiacibacter sp. D1-12]|uniref:CHASE2 domain-containing protein n=1 Tax=Aurantiacibacter sp. D1-12 TaxID=2993658 RepID=UPI00237C7A86|nr:adenylate/guanylate cyclase domain-containing protein [Aurantiacibacter sp. D1-12]MDE1468465.1 adenylate/guanylate cyclase domain-containing protein [Aurantiacibacter sp. D1-12]
MIDKLRRLGPEVAGLLVLLLVALLQFANFVPFERMRWQVFDFYQAAAPRIQEGDGQVVVVDIDEASIAQLGQWPWPRTDLAKLTRRLGEAEAVVVAYDIVFSEPDRTSPAAIVQRYSQLGENGTLGADFANLPSHDALFAEALGTVPTVTGFFLDSAEIGRDVELAASFTINGTMPSTDVREYPGALLPLPELEEASAGIGSVTIDPDADGIVRRASMVAIHRGVLVPTLSLETVRVAQNLGSPNLLASDGSGQTLSFPGAAVSVRLGDTEIPVNDAGEMWIHFQPPNSIEMISAAPIITDAMSDTELADAVAGKIVFVGGSAQGLQDLVATPVSADQVAGVTVHAAAAQQILSGEFLDRPDWALGLELLLVLVLGGGLVLLLPRLGALPGALVAACMIAAVTACSWLAFTQLRYLLDPTYSLIAIATIYVVQTAAVFFREERQRRYIHSAFDRYLSPEMVRQIAASPETLELGGEERDMSVMMCDIRGFSLIAERHTPREVIEFLIDFLSPMSEILLAHKATLDKYIGDAILAFWNAPVDDPDHHRNAARAALEMIQATDKLNNVMAGRTDVVWPGEVKIGIGLNSGVCCVGNMGSRQRLSYTLIGDTVNVASRLEGLTKQYGVPIIAGHALADKLEGFALLEIDRVRVVGRAAPETIFALLGDESIRIDDGFVRLAENHSALIDAYRHQNWDKADRQLEQSRTQYEALGIAGLHSLYCDRVAQLRNNTLAEDWDGVFEATQK